MGVVRLPDPEPVVDFDIRSEGSLVLLWPCTERAQGWAEEHINPGMSWAGSIVIEHRYALDIVSGIRDAGMTLGVR